MIGLLNSDPHSTFLHLNETYREQAISTQWYKVSLCTIVIYYCIVYAIFLIFTEYKSL